MEQMESRVYRLGEFTLDAAKRLLSRNDAPVHLAKLPFQVLLYLIEQRDRLVSRTELLERFWEGKEVYDDAVRKAVSAIRKALGDQSTQPRFIQTRQGGYCYIGPFVEVEQTAAPEPAAAVALDIPARQEPLASPPMPVPLAQQVLPSYGWRWQRASAILLILFLTLLVGAFVAARSRTRSSIALPPTEGNSIAILPLKNLSGQTEQEFFSDGLTESLLTELAQVRGLKVIARNSAFAFKGKELDVREIGRRLNVNTVLEGSVRRTADIMHVTVRLVSTTDGRILWTGDTLRPLKDFALLQDEISCSIAASLKTVLCGAPNHHAGTQNLAAYEAYLKGREQRLKGAPLKAEPFYQQAVAADPNYALAWAGLAEAYTVMEVNSLVPPRSVAQKAKEAAVKAIALDAALAAPYAALGLLAAFSDRDWTASERYFQQALANNPNYAIAHAWFANTLMAQGKFAEAEAAYLRARELDPLNPGFLNNLAETYHYWRQADRCLAHAAKALELDPSNEWARFNQAKCYTQAGRYEEALRVPLANTYKNLTHSTIFALSGRQTEARKLMPLVLKDYGQTSPYVVAIAYALLEDKEAAFAWLKKAADQQQADLVSLKIEAAFDGLRNDPRYAELLRRVGLFP